MNTLTLKAGYCRQDNAWDEDAKIQTRLADDSVTLYCARVSGEKLVPLYDQGCYAWDLSSINIPLRLVKRISCDSATQQLLDQLKEAVKLFDENSLIVPLELNNNGDWCVIALDGNDRPVRVLYQRFDGFSTEMIAG